MSYQDQIDRLRSLSDDAKAAISMALSAGAPQGVWPPGMPASLDPRLVLVGISPGNSPERSGQVYATAPGVDHGLKSHFYYRDQRRYWDKARALVGRYFGREGVALSPDDAVCLTTHLNLGMASAGQADDTTLERPYVEWASRLLMQAGNVEAVIFFGYAGYSTKAFFRDAWNCEGGLAVDWARPHRTQIFRTTSGRSLSFKAWRAVNVHGAPVNVVIWPNHPSRVPFGSDAEWSRSLDEYFRAPD